MSSILLITNDFGPRAGGIESYILGLLERMPNGEVIVYTSNQGDTRSYDQLWWDQHQVRIYRDRATILLPTPRVTRAVSQVLRENQIKTIWFGSAAPLGLMAGAARKAGASRVVALTHGHEIWWTRIWPFSAAIKTIGDRSDLVTYLGEYTRQRLTRKISPSKLIHSPPGIDIEHFRPRPEDADGLRDELALQGKRVIISVGRLVHRKGQDKLIEAMPQILSSLPNAHLLIVGVGPRRRALEKLVKKLRLEPSVTFIGRVLHQELPKYLSVGEVFVMPARDRFFGLEVEGLGIVYLEAGSCGLPVVAGRSGGAPDAIIEGETGFLVDGKVREEIAEATLRILSDEELSRRMSEKARLFTKENWSWKRWSEEFNEKVILGK
jgi:phosphatidylinositol alpha-1,6-mannosyltransferase